MDMIIIVFVIEIMNNRFDKVFVINGVLLKGR